MEAALPEQLRVKLSSEEAGAVSLTAVVWREMTPAELVELMLDVTGKDAARVAGLLQRGSLVAGATRYRWDAIHAEARSVQEILDTLPDAEPERPFAPERCVAIALEWPGRRKSYTREALARRRILRRRSFWDAVAALAGARGVEYAGYSHRERADRYVLELTEAAEAELRACAGLAAYTGLEAEIRKGGMRRIEFLARRERE